MRFISKPPYLKKGIAVISDDEKTGVQALERASETLPMKQGEVEKPEYEYIRKRTGAKHPVTHIVITLTINELIKII